MIRAWAIRTMADRRTLHTRNCRRRKKIFARMCLLIPEGRRCRVGHNFFELYAISIITSNYVGVHALKKFTRHHLVHTVRFAGMKFRILLQSGSDTSATETVPRTELPLTPQQKRIRRRAYYRTIQEPHALQQIWSKLDTQVGRSVFFCIAKKERT